MNPIDYFAKSAAKDTLRRVLGQPLLPSVRAWKKEPGKDPEGLIVPNRHQYVFLYGRRQYTIWPRLGIKDNFLGYVLQVSPGVEYDMSWVSRRGTEYGELRDVPSAFPYLDEAVLAANRHALRYGMLT